MYNVVLCCVFESKMQYLTKPQNETGYKTLCEERQLEPQKTFLQLIEKYMRGATFGPFEKAARLEAGFTRDEMQGLLTRFK